MLSSYGFILQLRRSPIPCCAGNGTLVTRVHRVHLTEEQASASYALRHLLAVRLRVINKHGACLPVGFWRREEFTMACSLGALLGREPRTWMDWAIGNPAWDQGPSETGVSVALFVGRVLGAQHLAGTLRPAAGRASRANNCCGIMIQDSWGAESTSEALVFHPVSSPPSYGFLVFAAATRIRKWIFHSPVGWLRS